MSPLAELLRARRTVLLDFDGPICAVFSTITDRAVATELAAIVGTEQLPPSVRSANDPFDVLRYVADTGDSKLVAAIETRFRDLECAAVDTAEPTPGAEEVLRELFARSYRVGVVTNNSAAAADRYLRRLGLRSTVGPIVGRPGARVDLLKPSPFMLASAMRQLSAQPADALFVGDSISDVVAGHAAGVACVALANKPGKAARFADLNPEFTITSMFDLLAALNEG
ncbi:HAD family hydrolase [Nocardia mangyaensis]|uniref:HAD family hydrolase n=1 Tax=Nocardia mangyaensis TaxID=2213200 RepID=UPI002674AA6F|nr:HAD family hydrolase [Nocardia mangyaensis]MDO3650749.1 HAD family hydrolase [Nocardia mangyaensis]